MSKVTQTVPGQSGDRRRDRPCSAPPKFSLACRPENRCHATPQARTLGARATRAIQHPMGKRSRQKRLSRTATPEPTRPPESSLATPARPRLSGWRLTLLRLALIVPVPVALLGLTEATLRWSGYGYSTRFFE